VRRQSIDAPELISKELSGGKLTLTLSQYVQNPVGQDAYTLRWKEVYAADGGEVVLSEVFEGKHRTKEVIIEEQELYYEKAK